MNYILEINCVHKLWPCISLYHVFSIGTVDSTECIIVRLPLIFVAMSLMADLINTLRGFLSFWEHKHCQKHLLGISKMWRLSPCRHSFAGPMNFIVSVRRRTSVSTPNLAHFYSFCFSSQSRERHRSKL